jgi:hypothetical protein
MDDGKSKSSISHKLNFDEFSYIRVVYAHTLGQEYKLKLAELALNNRNILVKRHHSKDSLI